MSSPRKLYVENFELTLVDISNDISHDISEVKYPYINGADQEDMGANPEGYRYNCLIIADDYEKYLEFRKFMLSRFDEPVMVTDPEVGILQGFPKNVSFGRDQKIGYVSVNFEFVIDETQPNKQAYIDVFASNEAELTAIIEETVVNISEQLASAGVPDVPGSDFTLLDKWAQMGDAARSFASACGATVARLQGYISAVKGPIDAISSSIDFVDSLSGSLTKSLAECCESFVTLARKLDRSPNKSSSKAIIAALASDLIATANSLNEAPQGIKNAFLTIAASTLAWESARLISNDESSLASSISTEATQIDDDQGSVLSEPTQAYLLTPAELEDTLAIVRKMINDVIKIDSNYRLKKMASNLAQSVLRVKMEYMTTKKVVVHEETPLHVILNSNGLNYKAAERVCALNDVINPTFMKGEVLIYAK